MMGIVVFVVPTVGEGSSKNIEVIEAIVAYFCERKKRRESLKSEDHPNGCWVVRRGTNTGMQARFELEKIELVEDPSEPTLLGDPADVLLVRTFELHAEGSIMKPMEGEVPLLGVGGLVDLEDRQSLGGGVSVDPCLLARHDDEQGGGHSVEAVSLQDAGERGRILRRLAPTEGGSDLIRVLRGAWHGASVAVKSGTARKLWHKRL